MKVSVVIPNFNGNQFLKPCLESLKMENDHIKEIIIVDNGSTDGSEEFILGYKEKNAGNMNIHLIKNEENLGFSKAVNQGIIYSKSDFIFLLNNDTVISKKSVSNLLNCIKKNDKIFSVSSKMIQHNNRKLIDDAGDNYTILGWTKKRGDNKSSNTLNENQTIFSSCGGAALYRKSVFSEIGLFDEAFFAYMEDVDIGYRAQIFGYENFYCSDAIIYHVGSGSSGSKYNDFKIKLSARNNIFVPYKNMPIPQLILNFPFLFLGFLIKFLFFSMRGHGKTYLIGVIEGIKKLKTIERIKYNNNIKIYLKIELKLILNLF